MDYPPTPITPILYFDIKKHLTTFYWSSSYYPFKEVLKYILMKSVHLRSTTTPFGECMGFCRFSFTEEDISKQVGL